MQPGPPHTIVNQPALMTSPAAAVHELAAAHARTLERAVAGEFQRQTRRMPFATISGVSGLAADLMQEFGEDLLNDLLILADRQRATPAAEWVMGQLAAALMEGAAALEGAAPAAARVSVSSVLKTCRIDLYWRCRAALGLADGNF